METASFAPYEKIADTTRAWGLDEAGARALARVDWVVTEKIHGAHFCVLVDGGGVRFARRKALLAPGEDFFGYARLARGLEGSAGRLWDALRVARPTLARVCVHGELFGGHYPHPDVAAVDGVQAIQTGVYYTPDVAFCAFDVAVEAPEGRRYLDHDPARAALEAAGFLTAAPLRVAPLARALDFDVDFDTTLPARLGLPPLPGPNRAEGVVLKPRRALVVDTRRGPARPTLKKKHPRFTEDARYHQASAWPDAAARRAADGPRQRLEWAAYNRVNLNRLASVASKLGPIKPADPRRGPDRSRALFRDLVADVFDSLEDAAPADLRALDAAERRALGAAVAAQVRALLRDVYGAGA